MAAQSGSYFSIFSVSENFFGFYSATTLQLATRGRRLLAVCTELLVFTNEFSFEWMGSPLAKLRSWIIETWSNHETVGKNNRMKRDKVNEWWASLSQKRKTEVLNWLAKNLPPNDWIKDKTLIDWAYETMPDDQTKG